MTNTTDNTQTENTQTKTAKPKRVTKKSIIRKMLLEELHSPEMRKRISADPYACDFYVQYVMDCTDDDFIYFAWRFRNAKIHNVYKGHMNKFVLTTRAYLLLHAYDKSASNISKRAQQYENVAQETLDRYNWYKRLAEDAKDLHNEVLTAHEKANSKNNK